MCDIRFRGAACTAIISSAVATTSSMVTSAPIAQTQQKAAYKVSQYSTGLHSILDNALASMQTRNMPEEGAKQAA
jgi:hypothetical protein